MILISKGSGRCITNADFGLKTMSDHSWISCNVILRESATSIRLWSMNKALLHSDLMKLEITMDIQNYLADNVSSETPTVMVWDALKATLRGSLIAKTSRLKKLRNQKIQAILQNIKW